MVMVAKGQLFVFASGNSAGSSNQCNYDGYTNSIFAKQVVVGEGCATTIINEHEGCCSQVVLYELGVGSHAAGHGESTRHDVQHKALNGYIH